MRSFEEIYRLTTKGHWKLPGPVLKPRPPLVRNSYSCCTGLTKFIAFAHNEAAFTSRKIQIPA